MRVTIYVYRTHDHDLMMLHMNGVMSIGQAAKKAVIAYYMGEYFKFPTEAVNHIEVQDMPLRATFSFEVFDEDAPGIEEWLRGIKRGFRNCYIKNILRLYLENQCTSLFRDDGWLPAEEKGTETIQEAPAATLMQKKEPLTGSAWVEEVAKKKITGNPNKHISDLDDILTQNTVEPTAGKVTETEDIEPPDQEEQIEQELPSETDETTEGQSTDGDGAGEDDDFDAFAEFQKMLR